MVVGCIGATLDLDKYRNFNDNPDLALAALLNTTMDFCGNAACLNNSIMKQIID